MGGFIGFILSLWFPVLGDQSIMEQSDRTGLFMVILHGFNSCQHQTKTLPTLSLRQQKQFRPLSTLY